MAVYSQCKNCNQIKNLNEMAQYSLCYDCEAAAKRNKRLSYIELRHQHFRKYGKVCICCGKTRDYSEYRINKGTGRISESKPCIMCIEEAKKRECPRCSIHFDIKEFGKHEHCKNCRMEMRYQSKLRICPMCHIQKVKIEFGAGEKCRDCRAQQRYSQVAKQCKCCKNFKDPDLFASEFECLECMKRESRRSKCRICEKSYPPNEVMPTKSECIYCAMRKGSPSDIHALTYLMRKDENLACKVSEFLEVQQHHAFVRD